MISLHVLSESQFRTWMMTLQFWLFLMAAVAMVGAPYQEIVAIVKQRREGATPTSTTAILANAGNALEVIGPERSDGPPPVAV